MNKVSSIIVTVIFFLGAASLEATRLVTYKFRGQTRAGVWLEEGIIDLNRAYEHLLKDQGKPRAKARAEAVVPSTTLELLQGQDESLTAAKEAIAHIGRRLARGETQKLKHEGILFSHQEVELAAPLPNPPHLLSIGLNYRAHAEETGNEIPLFPTVFTKEGTVIGPGEPIVVPGTVKEPDYEVELAFIMSRPATRVSKQDALDYVAGYMTFKDVSARDIQGRVSQWTVG